MTKDRRAVWVAMEKLVPLVLKVFATHFLPHSLPGSWPGCSRTAADEPVLPAGRAPPGWGERSLSRRIHRAPRRRTGAGYLGKTFHGHFRNHFDDTLSPFE